MVRRENNRLVFDREIYAEELPRISAALHQLERAGYQDVVLDFSNSIAAFSVPMLALCAQVARMRKKGFYFTLAMPTKSRLATMFRNANWAHLLIPREFAASTFRVQTHFPATHFLDEKGQASAVNEMLNVLLGSVPELNREDLAALEWSLNEITDNVLVHSDSQLGGFVQLSTFERSRKRIEFIVADAGKGIPGTLRPSHPELTSDVEALSSAIKEGFTRDKEIGQGNGLFGSYQVCSGSRGNFLLESGNAKLSFTESSGLRATHCRVPFIGTLVAVQLNLSDPQILANALRINGKKYEHSSDRLESKYESEANGNVLFVMKEEALSYGSRLAGAPVRTKLLNLSTMCSGTIVIDMRDISVVSSSFADEVFGKLVAKLSVSVYSRRFALIGLSPLVQELIAKAISQRMYLAHS